MVYVALHLGAGTHAKDNHVRYKRLAKESCDAAIRLLRAGKTVGEAAVAACRILESSPLVNAGFGSQLDVNGEVGCDAGYVDTSCCTPSCVSGITRSHPIHAAKRLHDSRSFPLPLGRHRPIHVHGQDELEEYTGVADCENMESQGARRVWDKWKALEDHMPAPESEQPEDTVGVIVGDKENMAIATSSGGPILKCRGRVGPVASYGCGFSITKGGSRTVAVCATGCGEDIICTRLSSRIEDALVEAEEIDYSVSDSLNRIMARDQSFQSDPICLGALGVVFEDGQICVHCVHTASSMIVAVRSDRDEKTRVQFLENNPGNVTSFVQSYRE